MVAGLIQAAGGLGLFLLGMSITTDGLKALADDRFRSVLARSTRSPLSAVFTGALATAVIQSSSATTVAAVGLVHTGLLTFSESLGIIFGANIGTTITGWLVALLGFKLELGNIVLPLVLIGTLIRLLAKGRAQVVGTTLAGFGLIFVGISMMQSGMAGFEGTVTPDSFPPDTFFGRLLLVLIGIAITLITQSSSAGVAAALAAVNTGTVSLHQAAAMVIGMDLGTTATAAMATIGGNVQARRTGFAHVFYNALTAVLAFFLLSPYFAVLQTLFPKVIATAPEVALVSFHTCFNILGVSAILPFTHVFARTIERLFPDREHPLVKRLDQSLIASPDVAIDAVYATLQDITQTLLRLVLPSLQHPKSTINALKLAEIRDAIEQTRGYLESIQVDPQSERLVDQYSQMIHVWDHLHRIEKRVAEDQRLSRCREDETLASMTDTLMDGVRQLAESDLPVSAETEAAIREQNQQLKSAMRRYRVEILRATAAGKLNAKTALQRMDAARAVRRIGYHVWRLADHTASSPFDRGV